MKALDRKLFRDLARMKGPAATIAFVIAAGVGSFISSVSTYQSLERSRDAYFAETRFGDVFDSVQRAPESVVPQLAAIPGIADVETRVVKDVSLQFEDMPEPMIGRLVSIPDGGAPRLGKLEIHRGRLPAVDQPDEVVVSEVFANAHRLDPGSTITAVINGRRHLLRVSGIGVSPEFIYVITAAGLPDDRHNGVLWIARSAVDRAFDMNGAFNDAVFALAPGASETRVIDGVDAVLDRFGGIGAYGRDDQPSSRFIDDELAQNRALAVSLPVIFLGVAAFLLNVVLARLVATQRPQIATLKALGYGRLPIGTHYAKLAGAIVLLGAVLGSAVGVWLGRAFLDQYHRFFRFRALQYYVDPRVVVAACAIALLAGVAGGLAAVRRILALPAAEAMRPEAPPAYHRGIVERSGLARRMSLRARLIARSIARRPVRALMTSVGMAMSVAVVIAGLFFLDSLHWYIDLAFRVAQRGDAVVTFTRPAGARATAELAHVPGVERAEGARAVPVRVRHGHATVRTALTTYSAGADLERIVDIRGHVVPVPRRGVLLADRLGERLGVAPGDVLELELLEGAHRRREVRVAGEAALLSGNTIAISRDEFDRLSGEAPALSGASLSIEPALRDEVLAALREKPAVGAVLPVSDIIRSFDETIGGILNTFIAIVAGFSGVIAIGIVYNAGRISFAERARELATLRILGFRRGEITTILLGELGIELALGIPLGWGIGRLLAGWATHAFQTDLIRFEVVIQPHTYAFATSVVLAAAAASALAVRRMIDRFDLVSVLKAGE